MNIDPHDEVAIDDFNPVPGKIPEHRRCTALWQIEKGLVLAMSREDHICSHNGAFLNHGFDTIATEASFESSPRSLATNDGISWMSKMSSCPVLETRSSTYRFAETEAAVYCIKHLPKISAPSEFSEERSVASSIAREDAKSCATWRLALCHRKCCLSRPRRSWCCSLLWISCILCTREKYKEESEAHVLSPVVTFEDDGSMIPLVSTKSPTYSTEVSLSAPRSASICFFFSSVLFSIDL
mmetsp:Transcript_4582/g.13231  ORF Transcript_4582/g.13231 Transcript_4582/m.13231 type:complete len:240 (-) Transcript_4582:502-1221(-)